GPVLLAAVAGALIGAQAGFWLGRRGGRGVPARSPQPGVHRGVAPAGQPLAPHGHAPAIVLAPVIPAGGPPLHPLPPRLPAPARPSPRSRVTGGAVWAAGTPRAGYLLAASAPGIDQSLLPVTAITVTASAVPGAVKLTRAPRPPPRHARTGPADRAAARPDD